MPDPDIPWTTYDGTDWWLVGMGAASSYPAKAPLIVFQTARRHPTTKSRVYLRFFPCPSCLGLGLDPIPCPTSTWISDEDNASILSPPLFPERAAHLLRSLLRGLV